MKNTLSRSLNLLVLAGILLTVAALAGLPLILTAVLKHYEEFMQQYPYAPWQITGCVYACAVPYLWALFRLKKISRCFAQDRAFAPEVVQSFRTIGICALAEAVLLCLASFFPLLAFHTYLYALTVLPALILPFVCIAVALLAFSIAAVFRRAAEMKEENESIF